MPLNAAQIREYLLPGSIEQDDRFRQEIVQASRFGLQIIGGLAVGVPALLLLLGIPLVPAAPEAAGSLRYGLALIILGGVMIGLAQLPAMGRHLRLAAAASIWAIAALLIWYAVSLAGQVHAAEHYIAGYVTLVMLGAVAAIPFQPLHTLALGLCIELFYVAAVLAAAGWGILPDMGRGAFQHLFIVLLAVLSTALTAIFYAQRADRFRSHLEALRISEFLHFAQTRVLLSENTALLGKLAATLMHELNSPIGALSSAVETLLAISAKLSNSDPDQQRRLMSLQAEVSQSAGESIQRLQRIVARMQRLTELDDSEVSSIDLNNLIRDVASLFESRTGDRVRMELDLRPLPPLACRPQQLSAVFSTLISNAVNAIKAEGSIRITSRLRGGQLEIEVQDTGRGIPEDVLATLFEPGFKQAGGRVATGNWSLFSARQIIQAHSGEIYITSQEGQGSTAVVRLPV